MEPQKDDRPEMIPVSQDQKTQDQVRAIITLRHIEEDRLERESYQKYKAAQQEREELYVKYRMALLNEHMTYCAWRKVIPDRHKKNRIYSRTQDESIPGRL